MHLFNLKKKKKKKNMVLEERNVHTITIVCSKSYSSALLTSCYTNCDPEAIKHTLM